MQNPLKVIPARYRRHVYAVLTLVAIVLAGVQASDGDTMQVVVYVLGALGFGTAVSNTNTDN